MSMIFFLHISTKQHTPYTTIRCLFLSIIENDWEADSNLVDGAKQKTFNITEGCISKTLKSLCDEIGLYENSSLISGLATGNNWFSNWQATGITLLD